LPIYIAKTHYLLEKKSQLLSKDIFERNTTTNRRSGDLWASEWSFEVAGRGIAQSIMAEGEFGDVFELKGCRIFGDLCC
jgi:hypothetical protein